MGKSFVGIMVAGFIAASFYYMAQREGNMLESSRNVSNHQYAELARAAAISGYERGKQRLVENWDDHEFTGEREGAGYSVTAEIQGPVASLQSVAGVTNASSVEQPYEVVARLKRKPPKFAEYAVASGGNLTLSGNISIQSGSPDRNVAVHTNSDMIVNGSPTNVEGFGSYSGGLNAHPAHKIDQVFNPHSNPDSDPLVSPAPTLDITALDPAALAGTIAVDQESFGSPSISGTYNLGGTDTDPYIWYFDGPLDVSSDTEFSGYVLLLVNGDVNVDGNLLSSDGDASESRIALYSGGRIDVAGNKTIEAQIFANQDVEFHGTVEVFGNVSSLGSVLFAGTADLSYVPPSPSLTYQVWPMHKRMGLIGYSER